MTDHWLTWCEPLERSNPSLTKADIAQAIEWYQKETGAMPRLMALSHKNANLALPEGIEIGVEFKGGVLRYEVWLADSEPVPIARGSFDSRRDGILIAAGTHFFCGGHLSAVPIEDSSPDPRYCRSCYIFLLIEARALPPKARKPDWIPIKEKAVAKREAKNSADLTGVHAGINATVKSKNATVALILPAVGKVTREKRGPKHRDLPEDLIRQWAGQDMGSKAITSRLKTELGIVIGFRTVAKIIKGERLLV